MVVVKHNASLYYAIMVESLSPEEIRKRPLAALIEDVFERRIATASVKPERRLIMETYAEKFREIVNTLPPEKRDTTAIQLQKIFVKLGSVFSEYGARFSDFVNNIINWPMIRATTDFPKDKHYQMGLARAKAWGGFALDTTKTATAERFAYRDHFLPSAVIGAEQGALVGGAMSIPIAIGLGADLGAKTGLLAGAAGVAGGALLGGALGGATALIMRLKDRIIGPPVVYYELNTGSHAHAGSGLRAGGLDGSLDAGDITSGTF